MTEPADAGDDTLAVPFRDFAISDDICRGLEAAGIFATFPIQALTLPLALRGQDIIGQARTGTGKTLAFGIPLLQMLGDAPSGAPRALVVVPTRELAIQVADDLRIAAVNLPARILTVYGGRAYEPQIDALEAGVDIVVGTPGRLLDLVERRHLNLGSVQALVLDEADKMLDLGFLPDVERIVKRTPDGRQTMLFSATMPGDVVTLARRHMRQPTNIRAEGHGAPAPPPNTRQHVFRAHQMDKIEVLARVLQARDRGLTMVFCQTKRAADQVAVALETRGFAVATVHGDLGQGQRERALRAFRSGKVDVLTATEVAARGLDVDDVTHVVNYECPDDDMTYVHRIGRTGRAGRAGVAVTFVDWRDMHRWKLINDALNLGKPEPEETYSTSEHLYEQLDIPREATGTLPRAMRAREGLAAEALEDIGETGKIRSASGTRRTRDSSASGSSASGSSASGSGRSGARHGGQARGGSGQSRSSSAAVREDGGQAAGGTAKPRRRRRTRAGHDLAAGQASADQAASAGQASAGQASAGQASAGRVSASQAGTGQADSAGQADRTQLDGGQPAKRLGRRRRAARPANSSEETRKAS